MHGQVVFKHAKNPGEEDVFKICSVRAFVPSIVKKGVARRAEVCAK